MSNIESDRAVAELHRLNAFIRVVRWGVTAIVFVVVGDFLAGEDLKALFEALRLDNSSQLPATVVSLVLAGMITIALAWVAGVAAGYAYRHREHRARNQAVRERATMVARASSSRMNSAKNAASSAKPTATANATCTPVSARSRPAVSSPGDSAP